MGVGISELVGQSSRAVVDEGEKGDIQDDESRNVIRRYELVEDCTMEDIER